MRQAFSPAVKRTLRRGAGCEWELKLGWVAVRFRFLFS